MASLRVSSVVIVTILALLLAASQGFEQQEEQDFANVEEPWDLELEKPATRLHELWDLTRPLNSSQVPTPPSILGNKECLNAVRDWIAGNYTNGIAVRSFPMPSHSSVISTHGTFTNRPLLLATDDGVHWY